MRLLCVRDEAVARLLCGRVEELTAELPLTDKAMEFMHWKEHGCRWTESLMTGVVPEDLKRVFTAGRAASSRGSAKASPATCTQPFKGHRCMRCWYPGRTSRTRRPCPRSPNGWRRWHMPLANGLTLGWSRIMLRSGSGPAWCLHSPGPRYVVPWYEALTVGVNLGSRCSQTIHLLEASWAGPVKYCRSSSNHYATSRFWRWPPCLMWGRCGGMTGNCGGSF